MTSTIDRRTAIAALAAERKKATAGRRLVTRTAVAVLALLLIGAPVMWILGFFSTPKAVADIRQAVDQQVAEYDRVARGEVPFGALPGGRGVFEKLRDVPPRYREQVAEQMGRLWEARERAEMASYFALPAAQRRDELDRRIKDEEDRRKQWQAERERRGQRRGADGETAGGGGPGGRRGPRGDGPRGGDGPPAGGPPAGVGGPFAGGRRGGGTEEARNERSKRRIDQSTPEQRAQQSEYRRAIEERRAQLGLPAIVRRGG